MTTLLVLTGVLGFAILGAWAFATSSPAAVATMVRLAGPILIALLGAVMTVAGRPGIGLPILGFAIALFARQRQVSRAAPSRHRTSFVRTAMLEMELDHDSGSMNGIVLAGHHEGAVLDDMAEITLLSLAKEMQGTDRESAELLQAYLDRRMPGWRDDMEPDTGARQAGAGQSGSMTHKEAYEILGLEPGASAVDIRKAHRRLIQGVHPDVGGSSFLAARINEAKDLLLRTHDTD